MVQAHGPSLAIFRPGAPSVARTVLLLFALVCAIGLPMALWKGRSPMELAQGFVATAAALSLLIPVLALCVWPLYIEVYSEGLAGRTFWGRTSLIPWSRVAGIRSDNGSGLTLVIVETTDNSPAIWTRPDVLEDETFQRLVGELAGPDHPLLRSASPFGRIRAGERSGGP